MRRRGVKPILQDRWENEKEKKEDTAYIIGLGMRTNEIVGERGMGEKQNEIEDCKPKNRNAEIEKR